MAAYLPDGSTLNLATTYGSDLTVESISNAAEAVVTSTAHGLSNGDFVEFKSGWFRANERVFRVKSVATDSFVLEGLNTTNTDNYPAGTGVGTVREISAWTQITQVLEFTTNGGEQQYANYAFLEEDFERQLPTTTSPQNIALGIADDQSLAGYQALKAASDVRALRALRLNLRNGGIILYNGIIALNETPTLTKGSVMQVNASIALQGRPVRY